MLSAQKMVRNGLFMEYYGDEEKHRMHGMMVIITQVTRLTLMRMVICGMSAVPMM